MPGWCHEGVLKTALDTLANGLKVLHIELPHVHAVSCALLVRGGPRYELPRTNGLSHMVEHLLFRGTANHPSSLEFHTAVEALGGEINGQTQRDAVTIHLTVPPTHAAAGLDLLAEVCTTPLMTGLSVERNVVIEEILDAYAADGSELDIDSISRRLLWDGHPMSMPVAGEVELVERFTRDQCRRWFEELFVARNAVLVIAGPTDRAAMLDAAARAFAGMPRGFSMLEPPPPAPVTRPAIHVQPTDDAQVTALLTFPSIPEAHPDFTALLLLRRILDDGFSARLRQAICEQRGLAYSMGVSLDAYRDVGALDIEVTCAPKKLVRTVERILITLRALIHAPVDPGELTRAKTRHMADLEFSLDNPSELSSWYGGAALLDLDVDYDLRRRELEAVTPCDLLRLARQIFDTDNALLTLLGPVEDDQARRLELLLGRPYESTFWFEDADSEDEPPPLELAG